MLHQAFFFHLPSHITYFIGTCKRYNRPAIQCNTRFVSPFIYFLDISPPLNLTANLWTLNFELRIFQVSLPTFELRIFLVVLSSQDQIGRFRLFCWRSTMGQIKIKAKISIEILDQFEQKIWRQLKSGCCVNAIKFNFLSMSNWRY